MKAARISRKGVLRMSKCTDCEEYNQDKHYCPKFCDVIRETTKEIQEFYKGEHEKLERIEQLIKRTEGTLELDNYTVQQIKEILKEEK